MQTSQLNSTTWRIRSEEHTSELQSPDHLVCCLLLEKNKADAVQRSRTCLRACSQSYCAGIMLRRAVESTLLAFDYGENFFFDDTATTEIYTLSLHDALPI